MSVLNDRVWVKKRVRPHGLRPKAQDNLPFGTVLAVYQDWTGAWGQWRQRASLPELNAVYVRDQQEQNVAGVENTIDSAALRV